MKKRLRKKLAKDILGVTKLNVKPNETLIIEVADDSSYEEINTYANILKQILDCKFVISSTKLNLTVVNTEPKEIPLALADGVNEEKHE